MVSQKAALMSLWKDRFSVTEYKGAVKPNHATGFVEAAVPGLQDLPCKLSFSTLYEAGQNDTGAPVSQAAKLFCDGALDIPAGSKVTVKRDGRTFEFSRSGEPGIFTHHQEIALVPFKEWA